MWEMENNASYIISPTGQNDIDQQHEKNSWVVQKRIISCWDTAQTLETNDLKVFEAKIKHYLTDDVTATESNYSNTIIDCDTAAHIKSSNIAVMNIMICTKAQKSLNYLLSWHGKA